MAPPGYAVARYRPDMTRFRVMRHPRFILIR